MTEAIHVEGLIKVYTTSKERSPLRAEDRIDFTVRTGKAHRVMEG